MPIADTDLQAVQLGALLHDIGKLYQRSGLPHPRSFAAFSRDDFGEHGAHAKWTADFVERLVAPRWPLRPHDLLTHHVPVPASRTARLIALADRLAAGERERDDSPHEREVAETQLVSVFSRLRQRGITPAADAYYPLAPLELDRSVIFPAPTTLPAAQCRSANLDLWRGFERDFAALRQDGFERYLEAVYHLLQRYCWCVPSAAYRQTPDVSLFDHSRLTCAIATCLALDEVDDERLAAFLPGGNRPERAKPLMLLVGGDLSGLQDFLYTITSDGAARTLRGRSFYLQLLAESAARFLMGRAGLALPNAIYWGGGNFYLLAPLSAAQRLEEAAAELEERMLAEHAGALGLAVGWVTLSAADFEGSAFSDRWKDVGREVAGRKTRRFGRVLAHAYDALFAPAGSGGSGGRCVACHADLPRPAADDEARCDACAGMEDLGREVALASRRPGTALSLGQARPAGGGSWWQEALWRQASAWWEFGPGEGASLRYSLNDPDIASAGTDGFRWIPSVVPWEGAPGQERVKNFNEIARDSVGVKRLGVLRMDVDDLGMLFGAGLGEAATASRVASLSTALRLFFEGWINRLCREVESDGGMAPPGKRPRSGLLYGVYSGGDDLFVTGAWDLIPVLARRIREDLRAFAAGNGAVRISGGIALVGSHLPLYQSARLAKEALEGGAKRYQRPDGPDKDAISFLGQTMPWEKLDEVRRHVEELAGLLGWGMERATVPRGILSQLAALYSVYLRETAERRRNGAEADRLFYGRWMWMAAYGLGRARERSGDQAARATLAAIEKRIADPSGAGIRMVGLEARWAELLTRSREVDRT